MNTIEQRSIEDLKCWKKNTYLYTENDHKRPYLKTNLFTLYRHILKMFGVYLGPVTAFAS